MNAKLERMVMETAMTKRISATLAGQVSLGGEVTVNRLGFGAMRLTGEGIWGPPKDRNRAQSCGAL